MLARPGGQETNPSASAEAPSRRKPGSERRIPWRGYVGSLGETLAPWPAESRGVARVGFGTLAKAEI